MSIIYLLFALLLMATVSVISSAISSVGIHFATQFANAEFPDYKETFFTMLYGYMLMIVIGVVAAIFGMNNNFLGNIIGFCVSGWIMYQLINKLVIEGYKNIIIFLVMSCIFTFITWMFVGMLIGKLAS